MLNIEDPMEVLSWKSVLALPFFSLARIHGFLWPLLSRIKSVFIQRGSRSSLLKRALFVLLSDTHL